MANTSPSESGSGVSLAFMLRAFRYRNYRLFFGGQIVSLTGTWITTTATSWLVYRLTGSAVLLGVVGFASQFPASLLTPFAGIFVDRWNRHRLLIGTQTASLIVAFVLATLTLTGLITVPVIIVISVVQGLVNAFDLPCRQAFVVSMIEDKDVDFVHINSPIPDHAPTARDCSVRRSPAPSSPCRARDGATSSTESATWRSSSPCCACGLPRAGRTSGSTPA